METFEEFFFKNADVPAKLKITAVAFFVIAFVLTGASILTSLALTFVYLTVHFGILFVIRSQKVTDDGISEPEQFMDVDTDEEDLDDYDLTVPQGGVEEKFFKPRFAKRHFAEKTSPVNVNSHIFRKAFAAKLPSDEHFRTDNTTYNSAFRPMPTSKQEFVVSGLEPSQTFRMSQSRNRPSSVSDRLVGNRHVSPESQHILGIDHWRLSRQPLRPAARNISSGTGFRKYASDKIFPINISKPSFQTTSVKLSGPQTSSPFHEQSPVGLWDTMSLSAIAGSPTGYISPITSPSKEKDTLNRSSPQMFVESPSPEKGFGLSYKNHPLHTTGYPVDSKSHIVPVKSSSSHWQRLNKKEQTLLPFTGRPRLQSPVTVRIAHPQSSNLLSEKRHRRRPLMNQDPGDSLRKDVILSALREKRKRGKPGQEEDRDEEDSSSFQDENYEGAARLKKRRLDNCDDTRQKAFQPKPGRGNMNILEDHPSETDTRDENEMEVVLANSSLEGRSGKSSFHRNAIVSSLSSSKLWKDNQRKRSLHSDEQDILPKLPPQKVTRGTDVSDLEPTESSNSKENTEGNSSKKGDTSQEKKEASKRSEHEKTVLSPRLRKRAVFTALHRGKQTRAPSPEQITAADLHEDRQRAQQRIQQMRMLLRDEEATLKETPKEAEKPLLPVAKSPPTSVNPLASTLSVAPVPSFTEVDAGTKKLDQKKDTTKSITFGATPFDKSAKGNPVVLGLASQTKEETPKSSSGGAPIDFGLSKAAPTSTLSVTVSSPPASSSKPSSLLQALSSMQKSVATDSKRDSSLPSGKSLGSIAKPSLLGNPVTSSVPSSAPSASALPSLTVSTNNVTLTTTTAAPTFNFGSGNSGLLSGSATTNILSSSATPQTLQFGSGSSISTISSSTGSLTQTQTSTPSLFNFGSSAPPPYSTSQSIAPQTVSSSSTAVSSVQSTFMFGSSPAVTQSGSLSSGLNFNSGSGTVTSAAQSSGAGTFSFGAAKESRPTFTFGQSTTKSQETKPSPTFGFPSAPSTVTTAQQTSMGPSPALFSFGAAPASATTTSASSSLFQMNSQTTSTSASSNTTPSPFMFGAAKPSTLSSDATKAAASFSFGQTNQSAGFTFGSQQSTPAPQVPLFSSNQTSSSQPGGFTFGASSQKPASQGSLFSSSQAPQQAGFSFGSQSSQRTSQTPLFPSAQQNQSSSMFGSTSTPALNFGAQTAPTPGPSFQFGAATPAQPQSTSGFNFSATPTNFGFGGATSSVPAFGQGQQATPPRPGTGFSMGSTNAPRKPASARMRQRQRAGRR